MYSAQKRLQVKLILHSSHSRLVRTLHKNRQVQPSNQKLKMTRIGNKSDSIKTQFEHFHWDSKCLRSERLSQGKPFIDRNETVTTLCREGLTSFFTWSVRLLNFEPVSRLDLKVAINANISYCPRKHSCLVAWDLKKYVTKSVSGNLGNRHYYLCFTSADNKWENVCANNRKTIYYHMLHKPSNQVTMIKIKIPKTVALQIVGEVIDTQKKSFAFRANSKSKHRNFFFFWKLPDVSESNSKMID